MDEKEIEASALMDMIKRKKGFNPDLRVIIRADKRARYAYVRSIMIPTLAEPVFPTSPSAPSIRTQN